MSNYMLINGQPRGNVQILRKVQPPTLNQKDVEIMNKPIINTEIETVINSLTKYKNPGPDGFAGNSIKHLEKSYCLFFLIFQKLKRKEHFQIHSMRPQNPQNGRKY